jgi:hypothetical protein
MSLHMHTFNYINMKHPYTICSMVSFAALHRPYLSREALYSIMYKYNPKLLYLSFMAASKIVIRHINIVHNRSHETRRKMCDGNLYIHYQQFFSGFIRF